jgi:hypothetical protein
MTLEDKQLLLRDLCARIPYGVRYKGDGGWGINPYQHTTTLCNILNAEEPLVYLRPMSSMTEEEHIKLKAVYDNGSNGLFDEYSHIDWLNAHHFDYRGLIEKSLAIVAPDNMYK